VRKLCLIQLVLLAIEFKAFGEGCYVFEAVRLVFYLLTNATSFSEAVTWNIRAGGDSCVRGIVLGAVLAAAIGVSGSSGIPYPGFSA
jgi:ADP-ribosylglycohydrolase